MKPRSSRHGDVLATVLIILGAATWVGFALRDVTEPSPFEVMVIAILGTAVGAWIARQVREDLGRGEAVGAALLATLLVPGVTRWSGVGLDRDALLAIVMAAPLTGSLGFVIAVGRPSEALAPFRQPLAAGAMMSAAIALAIVIVPQLQPLGNRAFDVAVALAGLGLGVAYGALVPASEAAHPPAGAAIAWLGPWVIAQVSQRATLMRHTPLRFLLVSGVTLAAAATLGWWLGAKLRRSADGAPDLPAARIHEDRP